MNNFEKIVADQVRQHRYLYDPSMRDNTDVQIIKNAWNDIATATGKDETDCRKAWKNLRDKFVRIKKRVYTGSIDPSPYTIMTELGWLCQFVKHRGKGPNVKEMHKVVSTEEHLNTNSFLSTPASGTSETSETATSAKPPPLSLMQSSPLPPTSSTLPPCPSPKRSSSPCSISAYPTPGISSCSNASPSSTDLMPSRMSTTEEALLKILEQLDWERERAMQQDTEDFRFAAVVADMLAKIDPQRKPEVKFKIHQVLYEAVQKTQA
ncbi:uncharacterized protein LOC143747112 [Siphateles boraxobius]|uniref:uncharacterized protein LOC143747112 n=1 Tax=Siphateles boraxobius TaxID=180520 RepID=UPI004064A337